MSTNREALREAVARMVNPEAWKLVGTGWAWWTKDEREASLRQADAALAVIVPAFQEAIRDHAPATQDMRSTEICDALDAAADALAAFLPKKTDG